MFYLSVNSYRRGIRNGVLVNPKLIILEKVNLAPPTIGWSTWSNLVKLGQTGLKLVLFGAGHYTSDLAIGAVLVQREEGKPHVVYYASKTLNEAQRNYATTEKELFAVVYALEKFLAYLVGYDIVIFTDHSALKYLLTKQNAKARLIRWVLLVQEFNLQIKDKKGVENTVADHLSRLTIAHDTHSPSINDEFPEESLIQLEKAPWYAHIANFLAIGEIPSY